MTDRPALVALRGPDDAPVRRDAEAGPRLSDRGLRTRTALLASARASFAEHGWAATTMAVIAQHAGVSLGTVYQYFPDKQALLSELVAEAVRRLLADEERTWRVCDGEAGLRRVLTSYVRAMAEDAPFWTAWEEVTHTDADLAAVRRDLTRLLVESVARELARGQQAGVVRAGLDPDLAASALTGMVDRFVYVTYSFDPPTPPPSHEEAAATLTELWAYAVMER